MKDKFTLFQRNCQKRKRRSSRRSEVETTVSLFFTNLAELKIKQTMRRILLALTFLLFFAVSHGQNQVDGLVQIGIGYHDNGEFHEAIEFYNRALEIDPESMYANYELALTYMSLEEYEKAIEHTDIVLKQEGDEVLLAYTVKGSALDNLGRTEESIELFEKAIEKYGDYYLLHYNLGINYSKIEDYEKAEPAFVRAIMSNPFHASSHITLALTKREQDQRVQSLLGLYYFLLLEPRSPRAEIAYYLLMEQLRGSVQESKDNSNAIDIILNSSRMDVEFSAAEVMLAMLEASSMLEENKDKTAEELFVDNTKSFFTLLGELLKNKEDATGLWWNLYVPFFYDLSRSGHLEAFCYYISSSFREEAMEWFLSNSEKIEELADWVEENME